VPKARLLNAAKQTTHSDVLMYHYFVHSNTK
jgi:hypothetical protein